MCICTTDTNHISIHCNCRSTKQWDSAERITRTKHKELSGGNVGHGSMDSSLHWIGGLQIHHCGDSIPYISPSLISTHCNINRFQFNPQVWRVFCPYFEAQTKFVANSYSIQTCWHETRPLSHMFLKRYMSNRKWPFYTEVNIRHDLDWITPLAVGICVMHSL